MEFYDSYDFDGYQPQVVVILTCNKERVPVEFVEFLDVNEDVSGRDIMTFVCPVCGSNHQSLILG